MRKMKKKKESDGSLFVFITAGVFTFLQMHFIAKPIAKFIGTTVDWWIWLIFFFLNFCGAALGMKIHKSLKKKNDNR